MTSSGGTARNGRGRFREGAVPHSRVTPATLPLPSLRATAAAASSSAATTTSVQLFSSIQSRPLQANPTAPFLWNNSSFTTQGNTAFQQQHQQRLGSSLSSASTSRSSLRGPMEDRPGNDHRGGAAEHVVQPHKPEQNQVSLRRGSNNKVDGAANAKSDRAKKVAAVNYNVLFQQQEHNGPPSTSSPSPSPVSTSPEPHRVGYHSEVYEESRDVAFCTRGEKEDNVVGHGEGVGSLPHTTTSVVNNRSPVSGDVLSGAPCLRPLGGVVEGPLPPDVRRLIAQSCAADPATQEAAEQQARRLISTGRRVKVYREELAAAEEERRDWAAAAEQRSLVRSVLQAEADDISARIQALLHEREICEAQLRSEDAAASREGRKLAEADERVAVLRSTIDSIVEETMVPRLMLQQLVPSLLLENYI